MITEQDLMGTWMLQRWEARDSDTGEIRYPYGPGAKGVLMYTADGWMSAALCSANREVFPADRPKEIAPEFKAKAFDEYFHYAGTYHIEGEGVIHDVAFSTNPNFPGSIQTRTLRLEGDILTLGVENAAGKQQLQWQRSGSAK